ncbi:MAG: gliding motility-associated ABC transporter permease subunit GldF [Prevotellaceae bacterium]|jgi:ABC-2 type transport system permease protein|nr:gliding motility-associated ABC transporter permease subunit GldF [Prevotellaceae bacterium]
MFYIFKKEVTSFFSSLIGCLTIGVFLLLCSWFLWLSPNEFNVLNAGYSNIDGLFFLAPWLFLFLAPAVTMRSFAEERKTGTMEMLLTRPVTDIQLIAAKFLAAVVLIVLALLPTLLYFYTVYSLGKPVGNIDSGATWGAFIGLLLLASCYAAVGIFASSLTDSQIVAFILAAAMCFFLYLGFDGLAALPFLKGVNNVLAAFGINEHYKSISRGVVEVYDLAYFVGVMGVFLFATRLRLQALKW